MPTLAVPAAVDLLAAPVVVHIRAALDDLTAGQLPVRCGSVRPHQVLVVDLRGCEFVDLRGFRALVRLHEEVRSHGGRMSVLHPPRTLRLICGMVPGLLTLVPDGAQRGRTERPPGARPP